MILKAFFSCVLCVVLTWGLCQNSFTQSKIQPRSQLAFKHFRDKKYKPASVLFHDLYRQTKSESYFNQYILCLIELKEFKDAESFTKKQLRKNPNDKNFLICLGYVHKRQNQEKPAEEYYNKALNELKPIKTDIYKTANAFNNKQEYEYAVKTYVKGRELLKQPHLYHIELGNVYLYQKDFENMISEFLKGISAQPERLATVQTCLQSALSQDVDLSLDAIIQNRIVKQIQLEPNNLALKELLQWYFTHKKQFDAALIQAQAIDLIGQENGYRLISLANVAKTNRDYETALKALQIVINKGHESPNFLKAKAEKLSAKYANLEANQVTSEDAWQKLAAEYENLLLEEKKASSVAKMLIEYSQILSAYLNKSKKAIQQLESALKNNAIHSRHKNTIKMKLADIKLFAGEKWDAILLYSQLEKANKNRDLGFEAKFKKAKTSYYMGEFKWAKAQLDALKGSASRMLANDALALSQLIGENNLTEDSCNLPMKIYAEADFLFYQQKNDEALKKLDELLKHKNHHFLFDEALFKKHQIYLKQNQFEPALASLNKIITEHPQSVILDKVLLKKGELLEKMRDWEAALLCYKLLIKNHPESVFSLDARKKTATLHQSIHFK